MTPESIVELTSRALKLVLVLSMPIVLTAGLLGLLIGIAQTVMQIQDQSIAQSAKLLLLLLVLALTAGWMGNEVLAFGLDVISQFPVLTR